MRKRILFIISLILSICFILSSCNNSSSSGWDVTIPQTNKIEPVKDSFYDNGLTTDFAGELDLTLNSTQLQREENQIINSIRSSVVEIYTLTSDGVGSGSGIIVGFDKNTEQTGGIAYILTCSHVIEGGFAVNVKDVKGNVYSSTLIGASPDEDIAVIAITVEHTDIAVAKIGDSADVCVGTEVYAIGNPTGNLGDTVTKGIISALDRQEELDGKTFNLLQIDSPINPGNSGGGLFTTDGYLIGVTNSGVVYRDGLGFAIPSSTAVEIANKLIKTYVNTESEKSFGYVDGYFSIGGGMQAGLYDYWGNWFEDGNIYFTLIYEVGTFAQTDADGDKLMVGDILVSFTVGDNEPCLATASDGVLDEMAYLQNNGSVGEDLVIVIKRQEVPEGETEAQLVEKTISIKFKQLVYTPDAVPSSYDNTGYENTIYQAYPFRAFVDKPQNELSKQDLSLQSYDFLQDCLDSVVDVYAIKNNDYGTGSGVIINFVPHLDGEGGIAYILTCHNVIDGAHYANIHTSNGLEFPVGLIGGDKKSDVAVLWADLSFTPSVAKISKTSNLAVGDYVYAIGNPTGRLTGSVSKGIVSSFNRKIVIAGNTIDVIQIDSAINPGSTGGGLFDISGNLVGLVNVGVEYKDGIGFAIPTESVVSVANSLISTYKDSKYDSYGYVKGRCIVDGITFGDTNWSWSMVFVSEIKTDSVFYKAGLRQNDFINAFYFGDTKYTIKTSSELMTLLNSIDFKVGDTFTIEFVRENTVYLVDVVMEQYIYCPPQVPNITE